LQEQAVDQDGDGGGDTDDAADGVAMAPAPSRQREQPRKTPTRPSISDILIEVVIDDISGAAFADASGGLGITH
jgi:hypothetical protein